MTRSVLVCDDDPALAADWVGRVQAIAPAAEYDVRPAPSNEETGAGIRTLLGRRRAARDGIAAPTDQCLFDGVDVLVVDYDLLHIDEDSARYTGESVARLARSFADCQIVIVLNQYPEAQFDLSLRGHITSFADLNIDVDLLGTTGLWCDPPWEGFRPWSWQTLWRAVDAQKLRARALAAPGALDRPIVDVLGMKAEDGARLSDGAFAFIAPGAENFAKLAEQSFRALLTTMPDGRDAASKIDENPTFAAQLAAARVSKWLEREVLGPQEVLVDIPHLLQRFPFLVPGDVSDPAAWNAAIHDEKALRAALPEGVWFDAEGWLSRPAVWWSRLESDAGIKKQRQEFDFSKVANVAFLEDVSSFCPLEEAKEFRAGFHNSFDRRFAKVVADVRYSPQRRFAFGA
ncbi:MAG: hypothetical protein JWP35_2539 [Caulobacter sp.]|nr:hypothetical protein [Caulobacter sp.]